jgi:hypothetical protein
MTTNNSIQTEKKRDIPIEKCWKYLLRHGWLLQPGIRKDLEHCFKIIKRGY